VCKTNQHGKNQLYSLLPDSFVHRVESALMSIDRGKMFSIGDFTLTEQYTVTIQHDRKGFFVLTPGGAASIPHVSLVMKYIIRSQLVAHMEKKWVKAGHKKAKDDCVKHNSLMFDEDEQTAAVDAGKRSARNIFKYTKLRYDMVYEYFCDEAVGKMKPPAKAEGKKPCCPDMYHPVMVTSRLLKSFFEDDRVHILLRPTYDRFESDYKPYFFNFELSLQKAPNFEVPPSKLPMGTFPGGGIPYTQFRRVMNTNLAAIASFFAFACYEAESFKSAVSLLQFDWELGGILAKEEKRFPNGIDPLADVDLYHIENYLFNQRVMDDGTGFVKNVVDVVNRLGECVHERMVEMRGKARPVQERRLESHLFRTMCSDLIEIYLDNGCFPHCDMAHKLKHPTLASLIDTYHKDYHPVPLLLEYVMLLIHHGFVKVYPSHVFEPNKSGNPGPLITNPLPPPPPPMHGKKRSDEDGDKEDDVSDEVKEERPPHGKKKSKRSDEAKDEDDNDSDVGEEDGLIVIRPRTKDIRVLYEIFPQVGQDPKYLKLPQLVAVILYGWECPWENDSTKRHIPWPREPINIPILKGKHVQLWSKKKAKAASCDEDNDDDDDGGGSGSGSGRKKKAATTIKEELAEALENCQKLEKQLGEETLKSEKVKKDLEEEKEKAACTRAKLKRQSELVLELKKRTEGNDTTASAVARLPQGTITQEEEDGVDTGVLRVHEQFVEACSQVLDLLSTDDGRAATRTHFPALESVMAISRTMSTITALQLSLLDDKKTLSFATNAELTSHDKVKSVMLQLQRVVMETDAGKKKISTTNLPERRLQEERDSGGKGKKRDSLEWMDRLFKSTLEKGLIGGMLEGERKQQAMVLKMGEFDAGGEDSGGLKRAQRSMDPSRLDGNVTGLFVPWCPEMEASKKDRKPAATVKRKSNTKRKAGQVPEEAPPTKKSDNTRMGDEPGPGKKQTSKAKTKVTKPANKTAAKGNPKKAPERTATKPARKPAARGTPKKAPKRTVGTRGTPMKEGPVGTPV